MTARMHTSLRAALLASFALAVVSVPGPAQSQAGGLTDEMNRMMQTQPINTMVLPMYATAEECGASKAQLAVLKKRFRDGSPGLPASMPGEIFDAFFERNLPAARGKVQARMSALGAAARTEACDQLILPER